MDIDVLKAGAKSSPFYSPVLYLHHIPHSAHAILSLKKYKVIQIYIEIFSSNIYKSTELEPPLGSETRIKKGRSVGKHTINRTAV